MGDDLNLGLQREECGAGGCDFLDFEGMVKYGFGQEKATEC